MDFIKLLHAHGATLLLFLFSLGRLFITNDAENMHAFSLNEFIDTLITNWTAEAVVYSGLLPLQLWLQLRVKLRVF
jgi:hypothetical protein